MSAKMPDNPTILPEWQWHEWMHNGVNATFATLGYDNPATHKQYDEVVINIIVGLLTDLAPDLLIDCPKWRLGKSNIDHTLENMVDGTVFVLGDN